MALPVYSQLLMAGGSVSSLSETVPTGFVWVVRDITTKLNDSNEVSYIETFTTTWIHFFEAGAGESIDHWTGHQVLLEGTTLFMGASSPVESVRVSGYQLTSP